MKLQFNDTVESLLEKICSKAGLPAKEHSLFMRRSESSKRGEGRDKILLNPSASLKEQGVPYTAVLELGPKQEFVASPKSNPTGKHVGPSPCLRHLIYISLLACLLHGAQ